MNEMTPAKFTIKELDRRLRAAFPEMLHARSGYVLEELWHGGCRVRKHFHPRSLRPGGTLSGPTMMALADFGIYVAILATVGWVPAAVTANLNINFLKMPAARDLLGEARLLKVGRRLAVAEIGIRSDGEEDLVAHATGTYAVPPVK
jgi:uncharacterized protein (TIGR00369 family)